MTNPFSRFRISIVSLVILLLAAGIYLAGVNAQSQPTRNAETPRLPASQVPDAPMIAIPSDHQATLLATFDTLPSDWERKEHTLYPPEFGEWETDSGKLAQLGTEWGYDYTQTMMVAPEEVGTEALLSAQVYPQGNRVVGLVFAVNDAGYYSFRVLGGMASPQEPSLTYDLSYYDAATETYRLIREEKTRPGYAFGRWQEIRVTLDGDRIICTFDGQEIFDVADEPLTAGRAGVYTITLGDVLFDNMVIAQPAQ